ncbi:MAG TPA: hypothetical protein PLJ37_11310 [Chitinophagales bacterium]|nr:hypothetical protein [Chitinophagales bacterium]MCB9074672.1 hypothetical protein [Chitinophagales bacterium]HMU97605.1 hypothetical protein [Chitinophagales bacterium]HMV03586.1 hypothetical protein [Chitinophagales bacterium]HMW94239.1 hypothetical protein [Chitinophagales bacterium]
MKNIVYIFLLAIVLSIAYTSCKRNKSDVGEIVEDSTMVAYELLPTEQQDVINLVYSWNRAHDTNAIYGLDTIYNETVLFYKKTFSKRNIIETKKNRIKRADSYKQRIIGRIGIYPSDTGDYKCDFLKLVTIDGKPKVYHTYLVFQRFNDVWKVIVESDKESDAQPELANLFTDFKESESTSEGDFDGDGEKEELIVIKPPQDSIGKYLSTTTKISFTNFNIPEIDIENCIGVNIMNENDVDGDGADDFSIVIKKPDGSYGSIILYSYKRGNWKQLAKFKATQDDITQNRKELIEFAGSGNIKIRVAEKLPDNRDTTLIKTISTWD